MRGVNQRLCVDLVAGDDDNNNKKFRKLWAVPVLVSSPTPATLGPPVRAAGYSFSQRQFANNG